MFMKIESLIRWFPDYETKVVEPTTIIYILRAVYADNFFVVCKNLVWCEISFTCNNAWNFSSFLVLEIDLTDPLTNFSSSDVLHLGSDFDVLEVVRILLISKKNWRTAPVWHNYLNGTDMGAFILPFESISLDRFVSGHSSQICDTWVPEIDCFVCMSKEREFSKSFETVFTWSANQTRF